MRLREEELDDQILALFAQMKQPEALQKWFREALIAWSGQHQDQSRCRAKDVQGQLNDVRRQQERLLNLHLSGGIDEAAFAVKRA